MLGTSANPHFPSLRSSPDFPFQCALQEGTSRDESADGLCDFESRVMGRRFDRVTIATLRAMRGEDALALMTIYLKADSNLPHIR
jgi:hypothetical protein